MLIKILITIKLTFKYINLLLYYVYNNKYKVLSNVRSKLLLLTLLYKLLILQCL
jgi:hypothetical protein